MPGTPPRKTEHFCFHAAKVPGITILDEEMLPVKHFDVLMHVGEAAEVEI
ncbi:hypothetical protein [Bacillus infantis]|nr:hypothetical protein [Bacillus infantis]